jgi:outer membrane protein assembly factor BamB
VQNLLAERNQRRQNEGMAPLVILSRALLSVLVVVASYAAIDHWPQWRGVQRDGQVVGFKIPSKWPEQLHQGWQVEVGVGHSSPVVAAGKVFVFSRRGEEEVLAAFNPANGKELWHQGYAAPYTVNPAATIHGKGPKSTPVVAGSRIVTFGISGVLTCRDVKNGKQLWQKDFSKQFPKTSPLYGAAMSPVVDEDKCIVHVGGQDRGALVALEMKTGEQLWSASEDGPGYASPVIVKLGEVRQVVTQSQKSCLGVDLDDGKVLWRIPFQTEYDQNAVTPIAYEGSLIFSGVKKGIDRYRIEEANDDWEIDKIWENKEVSLYMSSPVIDAERLFGFSHKKKGELFALDLTTGKTLWTSEGRLGENAAVLQTGDALWALTTSGELIVFKASDKHFEQLARYRVADTATWAHPVILPAGVLIKDETKLTLWQFPK